MINLVTCSNYKVIFHHAHVTKLHLVGLVINTTKLGLKVLWFVGQDRVLECQEP